jgi:hypothetical protein
MRRRLRLAAPFIVLTLTVAACGGSTVAVQEAPGGAVNLTTPGNGAALDPAATATATAAAGATATPTATTTGASASTGTTQPSTSTTTGTTGGGTQAPSTSTTGAATATPAPGSPGQQFEDFCAQNPGAC